MSLLVWFWENLYNIWEASWGIEIGTDSLRFASLRFHMEVRI